MKVRYDLIGAAIASAAMQTACVDTFDGIDVQLTLSEQSVGPALAGEAPGPGQPPAGTHFTLYAVDLVGTGDDQRSYTYPIVDFEILPVIDIDSPCFIDVEIIGKSFPGVHVTQAVEKWKQVTGIDDPRNAPEDASDEDVSDILTAERRLSYLPDIAALRALASESTARLPRVDTGCVGSGEDTDPELVPPPECIDDESNDRRLAICEAFWERNPGYYEGSDITYLQPLNGVSFGVVEAINPKSPGRIGGSEFIIDVKWLDFEELAINWQYDDADEDGQPDYPDDVEESDRSPIGYHYMSGSLREIRRGVASFSLLSRLNPAISGEATVVYDLGEDDVHF